MKYFKVIIGSVLILIIFLVLLYSIKEPVEKWNGSKLIGHAFGAVDGIDYTNSLEAFYESYNRGIRTFEVDFQLTSDEKVVLAHDWNYYGLDTAPTEHYFLEAQVFGKYTTLSFLDLLHLMKDYPDIWIVTDSKYMEKNKVEKQFNEMIKVAKDNNLEDVLNRFVIQIYNEEMYDIILNIYPFDKFIFTLYARWYGNVDDFKNICIWSASKNIKSITMWNYRFNEEIYQISQEYDLDIYVHTENNLEKAKNFLNQGVKGIYTDSISSDDLK